MWLISTILVAILTAAGAHAAGLPKIKVSGDRRFLVTENSAPLIWIGDTLWNWYKLTPAELDEYLDKRVAQGYTVIQLQVAAQGRATPDGRWCFGGADNKDITTPQEPFWRYSDEFLQKIEDRGLYAAVGLSWIVNYWNNHGERYSTSDLYNYGKWVGARYRDRNNIIWLSINEATAPGVPKEKIEAVVDGLRDGDTGRKILTLHPLAGTRTSDRYHDLVDFNSWQTARFMAPRGLPFAPDAWGGVPGTLTVWEAIAEDYNRRPVKPVIDLEAWYEGAPNDIENGKHVATAWHCRRRAYFTIFAGAFGHTYGAHELWRVEPNWRQALAYPGGDDMGHLRKLLDSQARPFLKLVPDQALITAGQSQSYDSHKQAARASDGSYAYVYSADGSGFSVNLAKLGGEGDKIAAQWFDPREGTYRETTGPHDRATSQVFVPPGSPAPGNDWVLVLHVAFDIRP